MSVELDEKFYIKFALFEQRQKEMDRNTMKTINVRTDQSRRKIVIRTPRGRRCREVAVGVRHYDQGVSGRTVTVKSRSKMTSYKQKTRTRELYNRERLNDDGRLCKRWRARWLKFIAKVHG